MTNDEVYAAGILTRALDPTTQPEAIRDFLRAEECLVEELIPRGARVVDLGCGMGRHLIGLRDRISLGVGIDYERIYIAEAMRRNPGRPLHFLVADATAVPLRLEFDAAFCLTNTWGTMSDKLAVLGEMRRLAPKPGTRLITVYASASVEPRCEWYTNMGHEVIEVTDECIVTQGGFRSEHFTEDRLRNLVGACELHAIGDVAYVVQV
ncbi:MAG TPA: class I SAM-dependent methyltransferase [Candidatus Methylomirabilis sp.]|nr:class I SAM-dependent methyltransferase [Candidatus Methylomirabilis sp.]